MVTGGLSGGSNNNSGRLDFSVASPSSYNGPNALSTGGSKNMGRLSSSVFDGDSGSSLTDDKSLKGRNNRFAAGPAAGRLS